MVFACAARKLYQTAVTNGLTVSILYDVLPQEFLETQTQERIFVQCSFLLLLCFMVTMHAARMRMARSASDLCKST